MLGTGHDNASSSTNANSNTPFLVDSSGLNLNLNTTATTTATLNPNHTASPNPSLNIHASSNALPPSTAAAIPAHLGPLPMSSAGKKRKHPGTTSRGVANLTPEQLAKKRANDRDAQRAIRGRTRAQIEALEQKVREFMSQQPYQDLQAALRQKQAMEAENEEIKRRLASVLAIIQPLVEAGAGVNVNVPGLSGNNYRFFGSDGGPLCLPASQNSYYC
jgi:hypothetical protein